VFTVFGSITIGDECSVESIGGYNGTIDSVVCKGGGSLAFICDEASTRGEGCPKGGKGKRSPVKKGS